MASSWLEDRVFFGAYDGNKIVGFVEGALEKWNNRFRISNIVVLGKEYRGKGVGGKLLEAIENEAKEQGAESMILEAENTNTNTISFYMYKGYRIIGFDQTAYQKDGERMPLFLSKIINWKILSQKLYFFTNFLLTTDCAKHYIS